MWWTVCGWNWQDAGRKFPRVPWRYSACQTKQRSGCPFQPPLKFPRWHWCQRILDRIWDGSATPSWDQTHQPSWDPSPTGNEPGGWLISVCSILCFVLFLCCPCVFYCSSLLFFVVFVFLCLNPIFYCDVTSVYPCICWYGAVFFCCLLSIICIRLIWYLFVVRVYITRIFVYPSFVLRRASWSKYLQYTIVFYTQENIVSLRYDFTVANHYVHWMVYRCPWWRHVHFACWHTSLFVTSSLHVQIAQRQQTCCYRR